MAEMGMIDYKAEYERYKDTHKAYRRKNSKRRAEQAKLWRENNKERVMAYGKNYNIENAESRRAYARVYKHTHRVERVISQTKRQKLEVGLTLEVVQRVYEDNIKKHGTLTCVLCHKPIGFGQDSLEHLIPITRGGTNEIENLDIAHRHCNCIKRTRTITEWRELYG